MFGGEMIDGYLKVLFKQRTQCQDSKILDAIQEEIKLSQIMKDKKRTFDDLEDKYLKLLHEGLKKFLVKYPQFEKALSAEDTKIGIVSTLTKNMLKDPNQYDDMIQKMSEIDELNENNKISSLLAKAFYEYVVAFSTFKTRLKNDRESLFSKEYMDKMALYADEGILLYHLETPDLPILDSEIKPSDILDAFYFNDCAGLKTLLMPLVQMHNPGNSMKRKQEDIWATLELLATGYYRSASRNLFSLLDSEHKKAAMVYQGILEKQSIFKNGLERSQKIDELIKNLNDPWLNLSWSKINKYYAKIVSSSPTIGVINRNVIVHGDYDSNLMDADSYAVIKLVLLWLNLRIVADYLCNVAEILDNLLQYLPAIIHHLNC